MKDKIEIIKPSQAFQVFNSDNGAIDFTIEFHKKNNFTRSKNIKKFKRSDFYEIIWIINGNGFFQVDFQQYAIESSKMIFLTPGQYFQIESGKFEFIKYSFRRAFFCIKTTNPQTLCNGVLFNHIYAVASINIGDKEKEFFQKLTQEILHTITDLFQNLKKNSTELLATFLSNSVKFWLNQSPFSPDISEEETNLLFDFRRSLELNYMHKKSIPDYANLLSVSEKKLQRLMKNRIGKKLSELIAHRQLLESKRLLYFTGKTVKEIAFTVGFSEPAYFNRFFKKHTLLTPVQFREKHGIEHYDHIIVELKSLIEKHFREEHSPSFYSNKLFLSTRTLSEMLKKTDGKTIRELIKFRLLLEAKRILYFTDKSVKETAWELGYEEAGHFSHFFKSNVGMAPNIFRKQWTDKNIESKQEINLEFGQHLWNNLN